MGEYRPVEAQESPRFSGIRTFMRLPHERKTEGVDFAVVGVPFDTGASYRVGARFAPEAIRSISVLLRPHNPVLGVSIFEHCSGVDYGDLPVVPGYIEDSYRKIAETLFPIVDAGVIPLLLGGDHSVTLPELRAVTGKHGPVALIHFDSHGDIWEEVFGRPYNHGTPFRRALEERLILADRSIQVGMRGSTYSLDEIERARSLGFEVVTTEEAREMGIKSLIERIHRRVQDAKTFVTFDIDFVDPAYAPGTGTIEVGGFTSGEALELVRGLQGLSLVACDVVEVLPAFDPSEITAYLAANIIFEFMSVIALARKRALDSTPGKCI
ncbi:MAG: agmatinase [Deltaproteobacteria bacterium]|nr:agmatinase [Deltaproteobacteria bacterium]